MIAKRRLVRFLLGAAVLTGAALLVRHQSATEVRVATVRRGEALLTATGNVRVLPATESKIVAPAQGLLLKFPRRDGDRVDQGDLLAELDPGDRPFTLRERELEAARFERLLAEESPDALALEGLRADLRRETELARTGAATTESVETLGREVARRELALRIDRDELRFRLDTLRNRIAALRAELAGFTVRAPYAGVFLNPTAVAGDLVVHGAVLGTLASDTKTVVAEVTQEDLDAVQRGLAGEGLVSVRLAGVTAPALDGRALTVTPSGDSASRRFSVRLELPNLPADTLAGRTGEATFIAARRPDALMIPRRAVHADDVFVVDADNRLSRRKVKLGYTSGLDAEVCEGLAEGDRIVTRDLDRLRDGDRVRVLAE